jgi:hypothetical protein
VKLTEIQDRGFALERDIAQVQLGLGDWDQAFYWLDRGAEKHNLDPRMFVEQPGWAEAVKDPRYAALLKKYGLGK